MYHLKLCSTFIQIAVKLEPELMILLQVQTVHYSNCVCYELSNDASVCHLMRHYNTQVAHDITTGTDSTL